MPLKPIRRTVQAEGVDYSPVKHAVKKKVIPSTTVILKPVSGTLGGAQEEDEEDIRRVHVQPKKGAPPKRPLKKPVSISGTKQASLQEQMDAYYARTKEEAEKRAKETEKQNKKQQTVGGSLYNPYNAPQPGSQIRIVIPDSGVKVATAYGLGVDPKNPLRPVTLGPSEAEILRILEEREERINNRKLTAEERKALRAKARAEYLAGRANSSTTSTGFATPEGYGTPGYQWGTLPPKITIPATSTAPSNSVPVRGANESREDYLRRLGEARGVKPQVTASSTESRDTENRDAEEFGSAPAGTIVTPETLGLSPAPVADEDTTGGGPGPAREAGWETPGVPSWSGSGNPPNQGGNWVLHKPNSQEIAWIPGETGNYDQYGRWFYFPEYAQYSLEGSGGSVSYGGGGGGGGGSSGGGSSGGGAPSTAWSNSYSVSGAPDGWIGVIPQGPLTPETEAAMLINAMIPYLSYEDQRITMDYLYNTGLKPFASYQAATLKMNKPETVDEFSWEDTLTSTYSKDRGQSMLNTLGTIAKKVGGVDKMGPGYEFLQSIAGNFVSFGGRAAGMMSTRAQIEQMLGQLDPLLGRTKSGNLSAYGSIANMLTSPFYSAGKALPVTRLENGKYVYGEGMQDQY